MITKTTTVVSCDGSGCVETVTINGTEVPYRLGEFGPGGWTTRSLPFPRCDEHFCRRCTDLHDADVYVCGGLPVYPLPGVTVICDDGSIFAGRYYLDPARLAFQESVENGARRGFRDATKAR